METEKTSIKEFTQEVEQHFGKPLNQKAVVAAKDLYRHWEEVRSAFKGKSLDIKINPISLGYKYPRHCRHKIWYGLGTGGLVLGTLCLFFQWELGVAGILFGAGCMAFGSRVRGGNSRRFSIQLVQRVIDQPHPSALAEFAALYISGIVTLSSDRGRSHWPQYPSDVFSGEERYIAY